MGRTTAFAFGEHSVHPWRSAVSLHSHTSFSEESLEMLPEYAGWVPGMRALLASAGDCRSMFWTPPLTPRQAYRLEEKQIQRRFGLPALVSLTDHDDIRAGMHLRVMNRFAHAPVSIEWTVPFEGACFHLGVHNITPETKQMLFDARVPLEQKLRTLSETWETLVILNHPLWDEIRAGYWIHRGALLNLLRLGGPAIHALEVNGLRSLRENREVLQMGRDLNLPVVAGGDRHGSEPNAILNVSRATTFGEFADEVRRERESYLVFMPQYRKSLPLRTTRMVVDILRDYRGSNWTDRVFVRTSTGEATPLSTVWQGRRMPAMFSAIRVAAQFSAMTFRSALR